MGVARAWSICEIKIFKPIPIHTENDYLSDAASEKAVSIKVPEI